MAIESPTPIANLTSFVSSTWGPSSSPGSKMPQEEDGMSADDMAWIITNSFIIFTMQTGFGLLESGCVSKKNEINIMVKNVVDVVLGGFTYWVFGYGLSFDTGPNSNAFIGFGSFLLDADEANWGKEFTTFFFQLSFATTATTIVSGAMAERCSFLAYCLYSLLNTIVYCVPAGWLWRENGFLFQMGAVDIAGSGGIHLVGGVSAFVSAFMLKPRLGRYDHGTDSEPMGDPITALLGMFMLWWGWLSFNCGSSFGLSEYKWKYAARSAVVTICGSFGGGGVGMFLSYFLKNKMFDVSYLINGVLASLVSITAGCALFHPWEAVIIGMVGAALSLGAAPFIDYLHVDDPVGAVAVHGFSGLWGLLAIGLVADMDTGQRITQGRAGLFKGGGVMLFAVQLCAAVCLSVWSAVTSFILLYLIDKLIPIRMNAREELLGADYLEHGVVRDPLIQELDRRLLGRLSMGPATPQELLKIAQNMAAGLPEEKLEKKVIEKAIEKKKDKTPPLYTIVVNGNSKKTSSANGPRSANGSVAPTNGQPVQRQAWY